MDILFKTEPGIFSYRVAGILIRAGRVLLQHVKGDPACAFPGGHVAFGETGAQALAREFKEETGADIVPGRLIWIGETFFPWGDKPCHQVGLYYLVELAEDTQIPLEGSFNVQDSLLNVTAGLEFTWVDLAALAGLEVYPTIAAEKLLHLSAGIEHFIANESK